MPEAGHSTLVLCGATLREAEAALRGREYRLVVTDSEAPDLDEALGAARCLALFDADALGAETTAAVARAAREANIMPVVVSRDGAPDKIVAAMRAGAVDYILRDEEGAYLADLHSRLQWLLRLGPPHSPRTVAARFAELLHSMQHDLKSPVNHILGYAELLLEIPGTKLTGEQAKFAARIRDNGNDLLLILKEFVERVDKLAEEQ